MISSAPPILEFGSAPGTYPPWYDPSYWDEGLHPRFDLAQQLRALRRNFYQYVHEIGLQNGLIASFLVLAGLRNPRGLLSDALRVWFLWAPAFGALALYALVWVEPRYLAYFFVMIWAAALTSVSLPASHYSGRIIRTAALVAALLLSVRTGIVFVADAVRGRRAALIQERVAEGLLDKGISGQNVVLIATELGEGWQKLARLHAVAEIPLESRDFLGIRRRRESESL